MQKILVLRGGALGDFLVTLPALVLLRQRWPDARIELAGNATAAALAQRNGPPLVGAPLRETTAARRQAPALHSDLLDIVHLQHEARWSALFAVTPLPADFAAWLAEFDLVVNFWPDNDDALRAKFPLHAQQTFLQGAAHPTRAPAAAHYCEALRPLGLAAPTTENFVFQLRPHDSNARLIAIHPGSGSPRKNWPLDRWTALVEWLARDHRADLLIVTGETESEAARALARFGTPADNLSLPELATQLARCRLFLGHDSGVSHLAAACGAPSVLLFGPTEPAMWAPPAANVRVLKREADVASLSLAEVQRAVAAALSDRK